MTEIDGALVLDEEDAPFLDAMAAWLDAVEARVAAEQAA